MKNKIYAVYIEFLDHQSESSWMSSGEVEDFKTIPVYQMGWLVDEDKDTYKVSGQISSDGSFGDTIAIFKKTVLKFKKITNLRLPK
jgi:hypothetical protein